MFSFSSLKAYLGQKFNFSGHSERRWDPEPHSVHFLVGVGAGVRGVGGGAFLEGVDVDPKSDPSLTIPYKMDFNIIL